MPLWVVNLIAFGSINFVHKLSTFPLRCILVDFTYYIYIYITRTYPLYLDIIHKSTKLISTDGYIFFLKNVCSHIMAIPSMNTDEFG